MGTLIFRGHFFRPGHACFAPRDRCRQVSFSAAQRRAAPEENSGIARRPPTLQRSALLRHTVRACLHAAAGLLRGPLGSGGPVFDVYQACFSEF